MVQSRVTIFEKSHHFIYYHALKTLILMFDKINMSELERCMDGIDVILILSLFTFTF